MEKVSTKFDLRDKWTMIIGIPLVAMIAPIAFGHYFESIEKETAFAIIGSTTSTLIMWLGVRAITIYLWNKYPWEKYPLKHLFLEISAILVYTAIVGVILVSIHHIIGIDNNIMETLPQNILFSLLITFLITSLHEAYFFFMQWRTWKNRSEKLHEENIRSQYETLKSQVNPHFLFNNLNTLANLIEENPTAAVDYVNRTADYYRKILSLREQEVILLKEEIELVNDYIFLQQKRFGENLIVNTELPKTIMQTSVAPLSLQMLVENALKHNIISKEKPLVVTISCPDSEYVVVSNNLQKREEETTSSKLGLQNIQQRYEYLTNKKVIIEAGGNRFSVSVPLLNL